MPLKTSFAPLGALPARFRRERVLIVGCGDVGLRAAVGLRHCRVYALTSDAQRIPALRAAGTTPLLGNLDAPRSLRRLAALGERVLHLAPPPGAGPIDSRTRALVQALRQRTAPRALVYGSTSGVYGDCAGQWVSESRPPAASTARAQRRVDAEGQLRGWGRGSQGHPRVSVLRIPGIYAPDRVGGTPEARLRKGTPVLQRSDDVFTNHIHADDLARACVLALWRARAQRLYHVADATELRMGDYFDLAADLYGLPRPPRISRAQAQAEMPPLQLSFMSESRRLRTDRLQRELRLRLRYPTVLHGLGQR